MAILLAQIVARFQMRARGLELFEILPKMAKLHAKFFAAGDRNKRRVQIADGSVAKEARNGKGLSGSHKQKKLR